MPKAARTRAQQRRFEWTLLAMALLALVAWLSPPGQLAGPNHLIQDLGLRALARPPHPDIVLVAVDDRSIATIGRWPWRRALHAQLLQTISAQQPQAIGLDILFSEADADYPLDDALLAQAIGWRCPCCSATMRGSPKGNLSSPWTCSPRQPPPWAMCM